MLGFIHYQLGYQFIQFIKSAQSKHCVFPKKLGLGSAKKTWVIRQLYWQFLVERWLVGEFAIAAWLYAIELTIFSSTNHLFQNQLLPFLMSNQKFLFTFACIGYLPIKIDLILFLLLNLEGKGPLAGPDFETKISDIMEPKKFELIFSLSKIIFRHISFISYFQFSMEIKGKFFPPPLVFFFSNYTSRELHKSLLYQCYLHMLQLIFLNSVLNPLRMNLNWT